MPQASINGCSMYYEDEGSGEPLVLVHGFPVDGRMYHPQLASLSSRFRVIVPDLRGFGRSRPAGALSMESAAADVVALMRHLGIKQFALGGLSMGGYVALALALEFAQVLSHLILIDTRAAGDSPDGKAARNRMIELVRQAGPKPIADQMLPKLLADPAGSAGATLRTIIESQQPDAIEHALVGIRDRADQLARLKELKLPTLIIVGEKDVITPVAEARLMHERIAGSQLCVIPNAGHVPNMEKPAEFDDAIVRFLDRPVPNRIR